MGCAGLRVGYLPLALLVLVLFVVVRLTSLGGVADLLPPVVATAWLLPARINQTMRLDNDVLVVLRRGRQTAPPWCDVLAVSWRPHSWIEGSRDPCCGYAAVPIALSTSGGSTC